MPFIVVWDSCTRPRYYADVHEVLALPKGALVRYTYKRKYFTKESFDLIDSLLAQKTKRVPAILFYGEVQSYNKPSQPPSGSLVHHLIPLRFGDIVSAARLRGESADEEQIEYDIELGEFPDLQTFQSRWLAYFEEHVGNDRPFLKWHAKLTDNSLYRQIKPKDEPSNVENWQRIVAALNELQFNGDSFFRISAPKKRGRRKKTLKLSHYGETGTGLRSFRWSLADSEELTIEIFNRETSTESATPPTRYLGIDCSENLTKSVKRISLRPYATNTVTFKGWTEDYSRGDPAWLTLGVEGHDCHDYPLGPKLRLPFQIVRKKTRTAVGLSFIALATVLGLVASKVSIYAGDPPELWGSALLAVAGLGFAAVISGFAGAFLLRKEFSTKV